MLLVCNEDIRRIQLFVHSIDGTLYRYSVASSQASCVLIIVIVNTSCVAGLPKRAHVCAERACVCMCACACVLCACMY